MHSFHYEHQNDAYDDVPGATRYVNIHHNGDYSGDVIINVGVRAEGQSERDVEFEEFTVPFAALKAFMAEYVRDTKIRKLEDGSTDELLAGAEAELGQ